VLEDNN